MEKKYTDQIRDITLGGIGKPLAGTSALSVILDGGAFGITEVFENKKVKY